jgi:N5-(cytidine 5'-diphosphoramidyl)-L-glutamine hydrolase
LIQRCAERAVPLLGVCRGLQMLVLEYGGRVTPVERHVRREHRVEVEAGNALGLEPREAVNSFHNFGVRPEDLPPDLIGVGRADDGTVEAVAHRLHPQWAVMWHPERPPYDRRDGELMRRLFLGGSK